MLGTSLIIGGCGGTAIIREEADGGPLPPPNSSADSGPELGPTREAGAVDATVGPDATSDAAQGVLCVPGQSIACVGIGGCSSGKVCNGEGSGYGPCDCAPPTDASTTLCIPGQSVGCAGSGGCISSQVCNDAGSGYGACVCAGGDGGTLLCVPGQSIACGGPSGCISFQVCNETGSGYGPCDCPEGGTLSHYEDGGLPDGYAALPPPVGDQGYNAIWVAWTQAPVFTQAILLPLFSAPDCNAVQPPYGETYAVGFQPGTVGPSGTFPACSAAITEGCYQPYLVFSEGFTQVNNATGGVYTLSSFNADGIATGQMNTAEGIVPLVVKNCQ